jgi:hypothetical protein
MLPISKKKLFDSIESDCNLRFSCCSYEFLFMDFDYVHSLGTDFEAKLGI